MMLSRVKFVSVKFVFLLVVSSLCAAQAAAQTQTARASAGAARAETAAPRVRWSDVRVEFEGNRLFTSERLRELTAECYGRSGKAEQEFDPDMLDYCLRMSVLNFVRRSGYLRAELGEPRVERTSAGETVTVPLDEKELYRLGRVKLEGAEHFPAERLRELLPLKSGDVADGVALIRWLSEQLKKLYSDEGFIQYEYDLEPEFHLDTDAGEGVADFSVTINEGRRFRLRGLTFKGCGDGAAATARQVMLIKEGEVFSARKFADSVKEVNALGLFEPIDADGDAGYMTDEETDDLHITIRVTVRGAAPEQQETQATEPKRPDASGDEGRPGKPTLKNRRPQTREE